MQALSSSQKPLKVGVLGGAFDPPHRMHQSLAQTALNQLELDILHIVPTGQAWHKERQLSDKATRLRMVELAFEPHKLGAQATQIVIDERELNRVGPSYTIDTLRELRQLYRGAQFFLIMGEDQAANFIHWKNHAEILNLCQLALAKRPGVTQQWHNEHLGHVVELLTPLSPISATAIRDQIELTRQDPWMLDKDVIQFIQQQGLYSTPT
jgi:nicotinate-nucleotide adenylyltransferase